MNRDFKGIWIPKEIWLNKDLTVMEKLFLVEIDSLDNEQGCFASNAHFSEIFSVTKGRCTQIIKSLEEKKLVQIELIREGKRVVKRLIRVVNKLNKGSEKIKQPCLENDEGINTSLTIQREREPRALDFLKSNYEFRFEQEFEMRYKSKIKDFEKFCDDFNDKVDTENLEYSGRILFGRLGQFVRNWIQNQNKYTSVKKEVPEKALPSSRKIK